MKLPLGALLSFVGYAVMWTGLMNIRVSYSVQGTTVAPSGKVYTLMDALTNGLGATPSTTGSIPGGQNAGSPSTGPLGQAKNAITGNCAPKPGDTKLPGGWIWRPIPNSFGGKLPGWAQGIVNTANGQLIGPC